MIPEDSFARIYTPPLRAPGVSSTSSDLSPAGVLQSGRDSVSDGRRGEDGTNGTNGSDGTNGTDGSDGFGFNSGHGFSYEEFTICDSGAPASRWLATWTSDPT